LLAAGGAVAFGVLPVVREKQKEARDRLIDSPAAYLLYAGEALGPADLATSIGRCARQFMFRV